MIFSPKAEILFDLVTLMDNQKCFTQNTFSEQQLLHIYACTYVDMNGLDKHIGTYIRILCTRCMYIPMYIPTCITKAHMYAFTES
jgi:hypothetical protein